MKSIMKNFVKSKLDDRMYIMERDEKIFWVVWLVLWGLLVISIISGIFFIPLSSIIEFIWQMWLVFIALATITMVISIVAAFAASILDDILN